MNKTFSFVVSKDLFKDSDLHRVERKVPAFYYAEDHRRILVTRKNSKDVRILTLRFLGLVEGGHDTETCEYGLFADTSVSDESIVFHARREGFKSWRLLENAGVELHPVYEKDGLLSELLLCDDPFLPPDEFWKALLSSPSYVRYSNSN